MTAANHQGHRSYRLRLRITTAGAAPTDDLDDFIQLKAPTAERAMQLAHHITGKAVIEATRIEVAA